MKDDLVRKLLFYMGVKVSATLREEHRLRVFGNRVLRGIFVLQEGGSNKSLEKTT
jgi:hypothetical protein